MSATALFPTALGLPRSPVAAVALILTALAVVYLVLNVLVRVGEAPAVTTADSEEPPAATEPDARDEGPEDGMPVTPPAPEPRAELAVEAVRVRGIPLALGDTASQVMRAFRPGEGERLPLVERRPDGMAARVVRSYLVDRRMVTLVLERDEADDPLRLTAMDVETA